MPHKRANTLTCVYCGHQYPEGTPPHGAQPLTDHIKICEKHPLRAAELKIKRLQGALEGLVGEWEPGALRQMKGYLQSTENVPPHEVKRMITAIDLLIELRGEHAA